MTRIIIYTFVIFIISQSLYAHELRPGYLEIKSINKDTYSVFFKVPGRGIDKRLALYVELPSGSEIVTPIVTKYSQLAFIDRLTFRIANIEGSEIKVKGLSESLTDVIVRVNLGENNIQTHRLTPSSPSFIVKGNPDKLKVIKTYTILGIEHILKGIDHLLFLVCLLIIAKTRNRILITITGFTIAHTITLALSALNIVRVPVAPVEAVIALSIVFVAREIINKNEDSLTHKYPITVSSSFGLLHGFGFASVLKDIGLPQNEIVSSLLFFNLGVEIGQILFVFMIIAFIYLIKYILNKPTAALLRLELHTAYIVGCLASFWLIERIYSFWY